MALDWKYAAGKISSEWHTVAISFEVHIGLSLYDVQSVELPDDCEKQESYRQGALLSVRVDKK